MVTTQTIVTAAGETPSSFRDYGYRTPKNLIDVDGAPILLHAIRSYVLHPERSVVAISDAEQLECNTRALVRALVPALHVATVSTGAKGALVTAIVAAETLDPDAPLVISAGDSVIEGGISHLIRQFQIDDSPAGTIAFASSEARWSYLNLDRSGAVRQVVEKQVVGRLATTGVFYFQSVRSFRTAAQWCLVNNAHTNGKFYVSAALNYLLHEGQRVAWAEIPSAHYRSFATPEDLAAEGDRGNAY